MFKFRTRHVGLLVLVLPFFLTPPRAVPLGSAPPVGEHPRMHEPAALASGGSPWTGLRKPLHQMVACFSFLFGITGVYLAFAVGPWIPLAAWIVAALAWQVCGG